MNQCTNMAESVIFDSADGGPNVSACGICRDRLGSPFMVDHHIPKGTLRRCQINTDGVGVCILPRRSGRII